MHPCAGIEGCHHKCRFPRWVPGSSLCLGSSCCNHIAPSFSMQGTHQQSDKADPSSTEQNPPSSTEVTRATSSFTIPKHQTSSLRSGFHRGLVARLLMRIITEGSTAVMPGHPAGEDGRHRWVWTQVRRKDAFGGSLQVRRLFWAR